VEAVVNGWELLDTAPIPGSREKMTLLRRGDEYSIRVDDQELMDSDAHASEEALSRIACQRIAERNEARVIIGGLGMGFTLARALRELSSDAEIVVAELSSAVVRWNREFIAQLAGHPLADARARVVEGDVADLYRDARDQFDAILLDVDNGPEAFTRDGNNWLYGTSGLTSAFRSLRTRGVLGIWSATPDRRFESKLRQTGFEVDHFRVPAQGDRGGDDHSIWISQKRD